MYDESASDARNTYDGASSSGCAGLPIGAQFIGPYLEDLTTIGFAREVSAAFGLTAEIAAAGR